MVICQTNNPVWKRNRNQYARLLLEQLRAGGALLEPFHVMPKEGALPTLQTYLTYRHAARMGEEVDYCMVHRAAHSQDR